MNKWNLFRTAIDWLGFGKFDDGSLTRKTGHDAAGAKAHGHTHGTIDPSISTTEQGLWAIKWSFVILLVTTLLQLGVVVLTGSVALLADTIHNAGDAVTAVPLGIAFMLARLKPSARFTYGYGRAEDLAGVIVVLLILTSAVVAGYVAIDRLIKPKPIDHLVWVVAAGVIGFIGNEAVAVFRIRVGRKINSAALIADGYHARTDGFTSLAVVLGALGVWLGFPLADPIIGLIITVAIFGIVWQSAKAVFTRMLDGVDPAITAEIRHAAEHIPGIRQVLDVRARWLGHRLNTELDVAIDGSITVSEAETIAARFEHELFEHVPALASARIRVRPYDAASTESLVDHSAVSGHHHAPAPVVLRGTLVEGVVEIIDTPQGERLQFTSALPVPGLKAVASIQRGNDDNERLELTEVAGDPTRFLSSLAPREPHEFDAFLRMDLGGRMEVLPFSVVEPEGHG